MKIDHKEIARGQWDGQLIWVCDFRQDDLNKKPIRNISPTQVKVRPNTETRNRVNYSQSFTSPLNKKTGVPLSKEIKIFDNTGWRSYTGVALAAFTTEEECMAHYATQCDVIIGMLEKALACAGESLKQQIDIVKKLKTTQCSFSD
jgi:hypothetical protein